MKTYKEIKDSLNEASEIKYDIFLLGGSIGSKSVRDKKELKGVKAEKMRYNTAADASEHAKRMNKSLSPGEKGYYKMKYVVVEIENGKYTGK